MQCRISQDYEGLKRSVKEFVAKGQKARIRPELLWWLTHILRIRSLLALDPSLSGCLTWEELRGLEVIRETLQSGQMGRQCPRCGKSTSALYNCEICGMKLD